MNYNTISKVDCMVEALHAINEYHQGSIVTNDRMKKVEERTPVASVVGNQATQQNISDLLNKLESAAAAAVQFDMRHYDIAQIKLKD